MGVPRMGERAGFTAPSSATARIFGIGQLGRRLALVFVAVALAAIAVNTTIAAESLGADINRVAMQQESSLASRSRRPREPRTREAPGRETDLDPVFDLAERGDASIQIRDIIGHVVASPAASRPSQCPPADRACHAEGKADRACHRPVQLDEPGRGRAELRCRQVAHSAGSPPVLPRSSPWSSR